MKRDLLSVRENVQSLFATKPVLQTNRLCLREIEDEDVEGIFTLYSDKEAGKFNSWPVLHTLEEALQKIAVFKLNLAKRKKYRWGIILKQTDDLIGDCVLGNFDFRANRVEIGFNLTRSHWNRGIMTEAVAAVIQYSFENLHLNRIEALVMPQNKASRRVFQKLGFEEETVLKEIGIKNGQYVDLLIISLLRRNYIRLKFELPVYSNS